jgi:serine/threonine-protein kinase
MVSESEKRAILSAVSRLIPDQRTVHDAFAAALDGEGWGELADLLNWLQKEKILTPLQVQELRSRLAFLAAGSRKREPAGRDPRHRSAVEPPVSPTRPSLRANQDPSEDTEIPFRSRFGEYRLLKKIGQGGMCPVYLGYHEKDQSKVAIKVLPRKLAAQQNNLDRFYREAKSGTLLIHPNIVRNLAFGQDQSTGTHYLILEYVDGPTAQSLLEKYSRLSIGDAVSIVLDIARGLEYAHSRNIIHRDIKPENILITQAGVAKLTDMGLAKRTDDPSHLTGAHQGFGTPQYMPYEQAINARHADGRSDIYALGATLYHLVTGQVPFPARTDLEVVEKKELGLFEPASSCNPLVPELLDTIIDRMMARDPKDRFQTISEVIVALERARLAPAVPSFANEALAYQDPVVRERLNSNTQPTCPDLRYPPPEKPAPRPGHPNVWYVRYPLASGRWCKSKATTAQVLKRLQNLKIPMDAEAAHHIEGDYRPLTAYTEFQFVLHELQRRTTENATGRVAPESLINTATQRQPKVTEIIRGFLRDRGALVIGGLVLAGILSGVLLVVLRLLSSL